MERDKQKVLFTVFTSTFNKRHTIHRVWNSLNNQTNKNFEWIVIDNKSSDNIKEVLSEYKSKAKFPIKIIYNTENLGYHFAFNRAVKEARGQFFIPADADDEFIPETLYKFYNFWNEIPDNDKVNFSGVNVLCLDSSTGKVNGRLFPSNPFISNNLELSYKYKIEDERWGMIRTDVLKKYPFPEIRTKMGGFVDNYIWYSLAHDGYKVFCVNEPLRIYYTDTSNSITHKTLKDPTLGSNVNYFYLNWNLNTNLKYILKTGGYIFLMKDFINLVRHGYADGKSTSAILKGAKNVLMKFFIILFLLPAYILYLLTFKKHLKKNKI
jgi:glycosyltransferase involved in cell wall biosynthesis